MASSTSAAADNADITFILDAFALLEEVKPDWVKLAAQKGISHRNNAYSKFRGILKKYNFKYENGRITKVEQAVEGATETSKKAAPKDTKVKATPGTKKRKLQDEAIDGEVLGISEGGKEDEKAA